MKLYRFLSEEDTAAFCHKVTDAMNKGWELYGSPTQTWDHRRNTLYNMIPTYPVSPSGFIFFNLVRNMLASKVVSNIFHPMKESISFK